MFLLCIGGKPHIAIISLNRPAARNAFSIAMLNEFINTLNSIRFNTDIRCVIIRSNVPKVFCAGADLRERATMTPAQVSAFVHSIRSAFSSIASLPMPTIAMVEGAAFGGGLELCLACDFRIANTLASFGLTETGLAIIPGAGGTQRLPRLIGIPKAKELIFTAKKLTAEEANQYGLLTRYVTSFTDTKTLFQSTLDFASEIIVNGPIAVRAAKEAIDKGIEVDLQSGLAIEALSYAQVIPTSDRIEGLTAFKEKRKPIYKGQ